MPRATTAAIAMSTSRPAFLLRDEEGRFCSCSLTQLYEPPEAEAAGREGSVTLAEAVAVCPKRGMPSSMRRAIQNPRLTLPVCEDRVAVQHRPQARHGVSQSGTFQPAGCGSVEAEVTSAKGEVIAVSAEQSLAAAPLTLQS